MSPCLCGVCVFVRAHVCACMVRIMRDVVLQSVEQLVSTLCRECQCYV